MTYSPRVTGIILAAGEGSRMGKTKQLLPFRGKTILECTVESALASSLGQVIVVLGHRADLLKPLLEPTAVRIVINPRYREGQSSSLKAGLAAVSDDADAVLFLLGDQPLVTPALIDRILAAYRSSESPIVMPVHDGRRGNPVLWSRRFFTELMTLDGDIGARHLIAKHSEAVAEVPVEGFEAFLDIDTPQALEAARQG